MRPFRREKFRFEGGTIPERWQGVSGPNCHQLESPNGTPLDLVGIFDLVFWSFFWFSPEKNRGLKRFLHS